MAQVEKYVKLSHLQCWAGDLCLGKFKISELFLSTSFMPFLPKLEMTKRLEIFIKSSISEQTLSTPSICLLDNDVGKYSMYVFN